MGFWFLDDRAQLALLLAGLMASGAAGCGDGRPTPTDARVDRPIVVDPLPRDGRVDGQRRDGRRDGRRDQPQVVDMAPFDMLVADPLPPPEMKVPKKDAAGAWGPQWQRQPQQQPGRRLPLARDLRVQIRQRVLGERLELTAATPGAEGLALSYRWTASGGALDGADARVARWTPPATRGLHMAQVTVRDGDRAISIDVYLHEVR